MLIGTVQAQSLTYEDLNNWTAQGASGSDWQVQPGGRTVLQTYNGGKFYFLSSESEAVNIAIQGTIEVQAGVGDNDFIGFTLGYQDTNNNYVFAWDQGGWGLSGYGKELWKMENGAVTHLASDVSNDTSKGWQHGVSYDFRILYLEDRIKVSIDGEEIFNVAGTFPAGKFGFYNESQGGALYGNVQSAPGSIIEVVPVVANDSYGMDVNSSLSTTSANGVFANDYDPNLDSFTANLVDDVAHGLLNLNVNNGSFTYSPEADWTGTDTFTYTVTDNDGTSSLSTVTLVVSEPNVAPTNVNLSVVTTTAGSPNGTAIGDFSSVDENTSEIFDYSLINNGGGRFTVENGVLKVANSTLLTEGDHTIRVRSTDLRGLFVEKDFTISVGPANNTPSDVLLNDPQVIDDRAVNNTLIGDLSAVDLDLTDTHTFTLLNDANGAYHLVNGNELRVANQSALVSPSQTVRVQVSDQNGATFEKDIDITVNFVAPVIRNLTTTTPVVEDPDKVKISWDEDDADSSYLDYGINVSYGHSEDDASGEANLELLDCTTYNYRVRLLKSGNMINGNDEELTTQGCVGGSRIESKNRDDFDKDNGGTVSLVENTVGAKLNVPANFKLGVDAAQFQMKKLSNQEVLTVTNKPSADFQIIGSIYDFKALTDVDQLITDFDNSITVTMNYTSADTQNHVESSFKIYRWHDQMWETLENCAVNTAKREVTCETNKFSIFGLFGNELNANSQTKKVTSSNGSSNFRWRGMKRSDYNGESHVGVDKHNFNEKYAESTAQVAKINQGLPSETLYATDRWGDNMFAGYVAGKIGLDRFPYRFQNIVRFGTGRLSTGREIPTPEVFLSSSPKNLLETPKNYYPWRLSLDQAKERFQVTPRKDTESFLKSAPAESNSISLMEDQVKSHLLQREYYKGKPVVDRSRDTSHLAPSRISNTKDLNVIKIRIGEASISMSDFMKNQ
ncbi:hypothetical protein GW777_03235 [Candidatus Peregrinibacteria bacterium]|nr:hypothetical protein [bacterium]NCQ55116.1 hypothetical protein [Candidatus Parcubacteria bacterium]NCS67371.1 hypothetical protein [Candidatus Peregrinibacteria bacterium]